jgi:hypothetical protein
MKPVLPVNIDCPECEAILRELLDARQVDLEEMRKHLLEAARSTGPRRSPKLTQGCLREMTQTETTIRDQDQAPRSERAVLSFFFPKIR